MIRYALACRQGHAFESWFQNSDAFDEQAKRGLIVCPACGSSEVEKALMAPNLSRTRKAAPSSPIPSVEEATPEIQSDVQPSAPEHPSRDAPGATPTPVAMMSPQEREFRAKLKELRAYLTQTAEHVGPRFPEEARKMHYGESDPRSIYGEASPDEARALIEEGIEFHPLPPLPDEAN
ncbi:MAG: DUF1178 family protein [Xanthobacteraceae bacterium]